MICVILMSKKLFTGGKLYCGALWVFLVLLLLSVYGRWLVDATPKTLLPAWWIFGPFIVLTDFLSPVFIDRFWFLVFCICGLAVCVLFWVLGRGGWRIRVVSAAILAAIMAAPFAVLFMYAPYSLRTVRVSSGYELIWLTQPQSRFDSAFKTAQREHDVHGCEYLLHGWGPDNRLYYGSDCGNTLWMYDPQTGEKPRRIQSLPLNSEFLTPVTATGNTRPSGKNGIWATWVAETSLSPDGRSRAAVIQDSFYGPFDLIVMHRLVLD